MLTQFEINTQDTQRFKFRKQLNDNLIVHYENEDIMYELKTDDKHMLLYGYAFDVRNPETDINKTLENLFHSQNFRQDLHYLNGQFYFIYKLENEYFFCSDAVCISPVYIDPSNKQLTAQSNDTFKKYNSQLRLNLNTFEYERIPEPHNRLKNVRTERIILDLVKDQYKYFEDKSLAINFRANNMNKALISILSPILRGNELYVRDDTELNKKVANSMVNEFHMNLVEHTEKISATYLTNTHLMDFKKFLNDDLDLTEEKSTEYIETYLLNDSSRRSLVVEYHLLNALRYHEDAKKDQFVYDPFNVRMIQNRIYKHDNKDSFDPISRIIKILKPMLNYYDFSTAETLQKKYKQLKTENKNLKKQLKESVNNYQFIQELHDKGIDISTNLDGSYSDNALVLQPASINISKNEIFTVSYKKSKPGMMIVETFFDNPRNADRIQVTVNGKTTNVSEYLGGKFINVEDLLDISMQYERDYNAASWQKAGKIRISEID
ncbi:MAG TPA: hypothetical protein K8V35_05475 [Aliicoccus persicus]|uniref:Uncharacterized protein n=1 Tax=Aliicoccus persicus TaxID=930138 RepID=A0A921JBI2_9STAP|nr:hypothetical protein [Aliicoccus persicus]